MPAHRFFPGKDDKIKVPVKSRGDGKLFRDGYALELNVPPAYCRAVLADSVRVMLAAAKKRLPAGYVLATLPAVRIQLSSLKDAPRDVALFGCDPSLNAYTGEESRIDLDGSGHPYRYTGGHLHFSVKHPPQWMKSLSKTCLFVKMLDKYVGLPLACIFDDRLNVLRRRYYGRAGDFRLQNYEDGSSGIEYRVPSSQIWNNQALVSMAFGVADRIFEKMSEITSKGVKREDEIADAINNGKGAWDLLPTNGAFGFYKPETIHHAAKHRAFHVFKLGAPVPKGRDCKEAGWSEYCEKYDLIGSSPDRDVHGMDAGQEDDD